MASMEGKSQDQIIDELVEKLLEEDSYYAERATGMISGETLRERHKEEIKKLLIEGDLKNTLERGFQLIGDDIPELLSNDELSAFIEEFSKINHENLEHPPEGKKIETFQDYFDLSNTFLLKIYALGTHYFDLRRFEDALSIFSSLATLNPFVFDFWNAKALCYQSLQEWQKALDTYAVAIHADRERVRPHISRAECLMALNEKGEAKEELAVANDLLNQFPEKKEKWERYLSSLKVKL